MVNVLSYFMIKPRSVYFNFVYGHRHHYLTFCMMVFLFFVPDWLGLSHYTSKIMREEMAAKPINAQRSQCEVADISLHYL